MKKSGHNFSSETDTEVLLHGYEEWEEEVVTHLRGMFAFALWDEKNSKLILARDRIGIKPLYYIHQRDCLVFASEAIAFQSLPEDIWHIELDYTSLRKLFSLGYLANQDDSVLKDVCKVHPGTILVWNQNDLKRRRYWQLLLSANPHSPAYTEAVEQTLEQLGESVRLMLQADVELGVLLSGGIDSTIVTALAQKYSPNLVRTFTVWFKDFQDERKYAQLVSGHVGTQHTSLELDLRNVFERLSGIIHVFDDLSSVDGGFISTY